MSQLPNQGMGTVHAIETILKEGGYDTVGSIILDEAASIKEIPLEAKKIKRNRNRTHIT